MITNKEIDTAYLLAYEDDARFEVENILQKLTVDLLYHADDHTLKYVYPETIELAIGEGFNEDERLLIAVAALYHDTGFLSQYTANEPLGAEEGRQYAQNSASKTLVNGAQIIFDAILNTNMQTAPKSKFEQIIRDADLSVMGKPEFLEWNQKLKQEVLLHPESGMHPFAIDDQKWATSQLGFLQSHQWFTTTARERYHTQKEENIRLFKEAYAV